MFEFVTRDTEKCPSSLFTGVHIEQVKHEQSEGINATLIGWLDSN